MNEPIKSASWKAWLGIVGIVVAVFVILVVALTLQSRGEIRQQILDRDGHVLTGVARMLQTTGHPALPPPDDLDIALQTSQLRGVLAVRLFDINGDFIMALPATVAATDLSATERDKVRAGRPVARYHPKSDLAEIFRDAPDLVFAEPVPLQEVVIPLRDPGSLEIAGMVQYLMDGEPVRAEFAALDRTLIFQAGVILVPALAGLILLAAFAFARLRRAHRALVKQTVRLTEANRELSLAARTSAVGAVTSHLIHGIRNALANLDVRTPGELSAALQQWRHLVDVTNRIRELIDDVVEVLREQDATTSFELTLEELEAVLNEKTSSRAAAAGVQFETRRTGDATLTGHAANILLLILTNLIDNSLSPTPRGQRTWVSLERRADCLAFEVGDEGPGIPRELQNTLFTPGQSARAGGTGLGLAISYRLANNLGADLKLARSDSSGTVFSLVYPLVEKAERKTTAPSA